MIVVRAPGPPAISKVSADRRASAFVASNSTPLVVAIGPAFGQWLQSQASKGATIVSICDGALVVAHAGLFKGHRATGHWATQAMRERDFADTQWLTNVRYVDDGAVVSAAGVSAAVPVSLALVEAIAGRARAAELAQQLGVARWTADHDSERFHMGFTDYVTAGRNGLLSSHDDIELPIAEGIDELTLAIVADAFGRTFRSRPYTSAPTTDPLHTRGGLVVRPDRAIDAQQAPPHKTLSLPNMPLAQALDDALAQIDRLYGRATGNFVSLQWEYAR
ncbi:MAG: hypothetical protein E6H65_16860 [Betaproteobacteria bacterium]|nr:MAG: hypothetical protein E6H65_16860 [Betaproteobacteria bacterium]